METMLDDERILFEKGVLEIFPLATVVLDDSKIVACNALFKDLTHGYFEHGDIFENAFVNKIGYIYIDPIFDWKHDVMEFYETNKILLKLGRVQKEFFVHVHRIHTSTYYVVSLSELVHYK